MIVRDKNDLHIVSKMLESSLYWTFDIETNSLNPRTGKIIGFGVCNPGNTKEAFYIIMKEWNGSELVDVIKDQDVLPVIQELKRKRLITWNGSFDTRFVYHYFNVNLIDSIYCDGMLLAHTCNENRPAYALKTLAAQILGADSTDSQKAMQDSIKNNGGSEKEYYKADSALMAKYGVQDNILTAKLFNIFEKDLKAQGLYKFFYEDEVMPLYTNVTIYMELHGFPIDLALMNNTNLEISKDLENLEHSIQTQISPHLQDFNDWYLNKEYPVKLSGQFIHKLAELIAPEDWPRTKTKGFSFSSAAFKKKAHLKEHELYKYANAEERIPKLLVKKVQVEMHADSGQLYAFNILSKHHLKKLLFEELKEVPLSTTELGNAQVTDELLDLLSSKYEWVKQLRTYNRLTKIKGTYIDSVLEKQDKGIFYPSFFQHRTVSGRYGSNLQQLPRPVEDDGSLEAKYTNLIRKFFIAGDDHELVDADFESLEPHVFSHVSGDQGLKNIFLKGHDFYSTIAIATEGLNQYSADKKADNYMGKVNKAARQTSKAYALGVPYGMGAYALAMTLKDTGMAIDDKGAQRLINSYLSAFPELKDWMQRSKDFAIKNGYIRTEAGRIRHMPELPLLINKYKGIDMTNQLEIWKEFNESPAKYAQAKEDGRKIRNYLNNALNVQIQGLGASIINRASIALAKKLKAQGMGSYICAQCHDEVLVRSKKTELQSAKDLVQDCLENTYKISIPLKAEPSSGRSWFDAKS